jgi:hypothetical protein
MYDSMVNIGLTEDEINQLKSITTILSSASACSAAIVIIYNLLIKSRRAFPSRMSTYFAVANLFFALTISLGSINDFSVLSHSTLCTVQGFFFQYFGLSMVIWYSLIYYTLYQITSNNKSFLNIARWETGFLCLGWLFPLLPNILALSMDRFGYESPLLWCWFAASSQNTVWKFCAIYGFLGISLFFAAIWLIRILRSMRRMQHSSRIVADYAARHIPFILCVFVAFFQIYAWGINFELVTRGKSSIPFWFSVCEVLAVCSLGLPLLIVFGPRLQEIYDYFLRGPQLSAPPGEDEDLVEEEEAEDIAEDIYDPLKQPLNTNFA